MKLQPLLALGLTILAAATQAFGGATLDRVEQKRELVGVLMESYPPFSFLNDQNQLDGFDVDVAKAVADKLGVKLRLETPSWDVIAAGRWSGRYDICICSMTPSKARAEVFDFPVEYYASPAVIVVKAKDDRIHGAKDLSGKKVGLPRSSYESYSTKIWSSKARKTRSCSTRSRMCRSPRMTPTTSPSRTWAWVPACVWMRSSPTSSLTSRA